MDLIAYAVPFFLLALLVELTVDLARKTRRYRLNDAVNSLSAGVLNTTTGYFTRLLPLFVWGIVLENVALFDMPLSAFDASPAGVALWLAAIFGWDFFYYWYHRLSHEISVLWAAHAVHHQSEDYNLSTALRQTSSGFLFGWVFYLPLFLIGFPLEVLLVANAVSLIYQFWVHTQFVRKLGVLDRVFVTPSNHRVHHAQNELYIDRNYGGILILWDRLFGTYQDELDDEPVVFGVRKPLASWNPFWANLQVYDYLLFDARHAMRWRDKIGVWVRRTGWRPADVEARYPKMRANLGAFEKFDPPVAASVRAYVLMQFMVATAMTLGLSVLYATQGLDAVIVPGVLLWSLLYTLGLINEGRPYAVRFELIRLWVIVPLGAVATEPQSTLLLAAVAYAVLSSMGLLFSIKKQ